MSHLSEVAQVEGICSTTVRQIDGRVHNVRQEVSSDLGSNKTQEEDSAVTVQLNSGD
jgi:hypothetical protein